MSQRWLEPFDEYTSAADMTQGWWAQVDAIWAPTTDNPRTGTQALRFLADSVGSGYARRIIGTPVSGGGLEFALDIQVLPTAEGADGFAVVALNASAQANLAFQLGTDGSWIAYTGWNFGSPGSSALVEVGRSSPATTVTTYMQIGFKIGLVDETHGTAEVRVNGVTILNLTSINTDQYATGEMSQWALWGGPDASILPIDIDDMHCWDVNLGNGPSDFVGNAAVIYRKPSADTATQQWTAFGGSAPPYYPLVSDNSDSTGISAATTSLSAGFTFPNLPPATGGVISQQLNLRGEKSDAGDGTITPIMAVGAAQITNAGIALGTSYAWFGSVFAYDPAGSETPWTVEDANVCQGILERTA